jgi:hypothetical protein
MKGRNPKRDILTTDDTDDTDGKSKDTNPISAKDVEKIKTF